MNQNDSREMFSNDSPRSFQRSQRAEKTWHDSDDLEEESELDFG